MLSWGLLEAKIKRNFSFPLTRSKTNLHILGPQKLVWYIFSKFSEKCSFLRSLWFCENENFGFAAKFADFLELDSWKNTWSAACAHFRNLQESVISLHPTAESHWVVCMTLWSQTSQCVWQHKMCSCLYTWSQTLWKTGQSGVILVMCRYRRRIDLEDKAKVVASDWGTESLLR